MDPVTLLQISHMDQRLARETAARERLAAPLRAAAAAARRARLAASLEGLGARLTRRPAPAPQACATC